LHIDECDLFGKNLKRLPYSSRPYENRIPEGAQSMVHHAPTNSLIILDPRESRPQVFDRRGKWTHHLLDLDDLLDEVTIDADDEHHVYAMAVGADNLLYVADALHHQIAAMAVTNKGEPGRIVKILRFPGPVPLRPMAIGFDHHQQLYFCAKGTYGLHICTVARQSDLPAHSEITFSVNTFSVPTRTMTPAVYLTLPGDDKQSLVHTLADPVPGKYLETHLRYKRIVFSSLPHSKETKSGQEPPKQCFECVTIQSDHVQMLHPRVYCVPLGFCIGTAREIFVWDGQGSVHVYGVRSSPKYIDSMDELD